MALDGKQIKPASVANAKLATASNVASADSVVLSKANSKIDISYIPTDDPAFRPNFSYTALTSADTIVVPEGQTMLIVDDLNIGDGTLTVAGTVSGTAQDLVNIRPWWPTVFGVGTYVLKVGRINKYNNKASGGTMVLHLPPNPAEGDVVELKEVGDAADTVTLTTESGTTKIESVSASADVTSVTLNQAKLYLSYKWDTVNATWRLIGMVSRASGNVVASPLIEDQLATLATSVNGDAVSAAGLTQAPNQFSIILVYLNGVGVNHISYGSKTASLFFSNDGGATAASRSAVTTGSKLHWNGTTAGFQLQSGWTIKVVYSV